MEPIVSRDSIRDLARAAAAPDRPVQGVNPFPEHTTAHHQFETDYWAAVREREQQEALT